MAVVVPAAGAALLAIDIAETVLIQIVGQLVSATVGAALAPELAGLQEESYRINPSLQLPLADVIAAVVKGHMSIEEGRQEARLSGISDTTAPTGSLTGFLSGQGQAGPSRPRFDILLDTAGEPPGPATLLELWRRKVIPESGTGPNAVSVEQGIREGQTKNKWIAPLKALKTALPSPESALQALLEGQTDKATALDLYEQWGGDPRYFDLMFETRGSAPTPLEAAEMARRGIIPWTGQGPLVVSFEQAFLEGPWRNKWMAPMRALSTYIPPPRTVTAMLREGAFTEAQAMRFYKDAGLDEATAAAYLEAAHHQRTAATKELAKADILALMVDELIEEPAALGMLEALGYAAETANFEIEIARFRAEHVLLNQTLGRLRTLYVAHKIDKPQALSALDSLGLTPTARDKQLGYWEQARANNVTILTAAQIGELVKLQWLSFAAAADLLQGHGYTAEDAQLYLLSHLKVAANAKPLPDGVTVSPR